MPPRRPDSRPSGAHRNRSAGSSGRRAHRPRRRGFGLWPITVVLSVTLVVLVTMLVVRDDGTSIGTEAAEGEAVELTTAANGSDHGDRANGAGTGGATGGSDAGSGADAGEARKVHAAQRTRKAKQRAAAERAALEPTVANGLLCRPAPGRSPLVRKRAGGTSKRIALTFDDGPTAKYTGPVLDILREHDVPATFFVIGSQVGPNVELVRRIVRDGHALANHTWSHADVSEGGEAANVQLMDTQYAIQLAVGQAGCLMRPPGGAVGPGLEAWLTDHKKVGVLWDVDSNDYQRPSAAAMTRQIVSATRAGSIILLHDGGGDRANTVAAVPGIITRLKAEGYEFVTVPELLRLPRAKG